MLLVNRWIYGCRGSSLGGGGWLAGWLGEVFRAFW